MMKFTKRLSSMSRTHPVFTLTVTNCGLAAVADCLGQYVSHASSDVTTQTLGFDYSRFYRFVAYQGFAAPVLFKWFKYIDRAVPLPASPKEFPSTTRGADANSKKLSSSRLALYKAVSKRVAMDQFLFAPVSLCVFFICMSFFETGDFSQVKEKLSETYWTALFSNWKVWPIVQFVNFCYVPLFFRLPFASIVGIFWNTYLSILNGHTNPPAPLDV